MLADRVLVQDGYETEFVPARLAEMKPGYGKGLYYATKTKEDLRKYMRHTEYPYMDLGGSDGNLRPDFFTDARWDDKTWMDPLPC